MKFTGQEHGPTYQTIFSVWKSFKPSLERAVLSAVQLDCREARSQELILSSRTVTYIVRISAKNIQKENCLVC